MKITNKLLSFIVSNKYKKNFIKLNFNDLNNLERFLQDHYHQGWRSKENYTKETFENDLNAHLINRLNSDRIKYIPWLGKNIQLNGCKILEIGCGTGSSTVALAEQGAIVTGIDIDKDALLVAEKRCDLYNVPSSFILGNAMELPSNLKDTEFNLVIFWACMEHMTYEERIISLKKYWKLLKPGNLLAIINTPNRLWYYDKHTSQLPFFNWLPDKVAFDYSRYSERVNFKDSYNEYSENKFLHFLRRGRGFSFHELEIALNIRADKLNVISHLNNNIIWRQRLKLSERIFHRILARINPSINKGFFFPDIDIIIKK